MKLSKRIQRRYALAMDAASEAVKRASMLKRQHEEATDELRRELETLRIYRDETEASLRKLAARFKAKYHVQLKQLGLYRAPRCEDR